MRHMVKVFLALVKMNFSYNSHYRANAIMHFVVSFCWVAFYFWTVNIIFMFTDNLIGWNKNEVLLLVGLFRIIKSVVDVLVRVNFTRFFETIRFGDFDFYLAKPLNPLILSSFKIMVFPEISNFFVGLFFIVTVVGFKGLINPIFLFNLFFGVVFGSIAYYTFCFSLIPIAFYFQRLTAMNEMVNILSQTIRYPMNVYTRDIVIYEILTLPLAVVVYYPTKIILGKSSNYWLYAIEPIIVFLLFFVVYRWWTYSLRRYSSASS